MTSQTADLNWGSLALVTYLPDPLGSFLTGLRQLLAGEHKPEAHITFLPPRPLALPVEGAATEVRQILFGVEQFVVELGAVHVFPGTNSLYLSLERGRSDLLRLHESLNGGNLFARENFEFIPHLTLSGELTPGELDEAFGTAESAWNASTLSRSFLVSDVILLWQAGCFDREWSRLSSFPLRKAASKNVAGLS